MTDNTYGPFRPDELFALPCEREIAAIDDGSIERHMGNDAAGDVIEVGLRKRFPNIDDDELLSVAGGMLFGIEIVRHRYEQALRDAENAPRRPPNPRTHPLEPAFDAYWALHADAFTAWPVGRAHAAFAAGWKAAEAQARAVDDIVTTDAPIDAAENK
jgi:hypothetical protein